MYFLISMYDKENKDIRLYCGLSMYYKQYLLDNKF